MELFQKHIEKLRSMPVALMTDSETVAKALAVRGKLLKNIVLEKLTFQEKEAKTGVLYDFYQTYRDSVFEKLTLDDFADTFAQMLVYGSFLVKLNADTKKIHLHNAKSYIPVSNRLIIDLFSFLKELDNEEYPQIKWIVEEIFTTTNNLKIKELDKKFSFDMHQKDPYIYFYDCETNF